ncbi:MAG: hypothetical protein GY801_38120 [bacterium]|nr:hypothetical protein [bacterium]
MIISIGVIAGCDSTPAPTPKPTAANTVTPTEQKKGIVSVMGSWRTDDVEQMNRSLAKFHEKYPNITGAECCFST